MLVSDHHWLILLHLIISGTWNIFLCLSNLFESHCAPLVAFLEKLFLKKDCILSNENFVLMKVIEIIPFGLPRIQQIDTLIRSRLELCWHQTFNICRHATQNLQESLTSMFPSSYLIWCRSSPQIWIVHSQFSVNVAVSSTYPKSMMEDQFDSSLTSLCPIGFGFSI
jgi:hypothetical protein